MRSKKRKVAHVPMAPMIDMVFLLLVFFMTASAMSTEGSKIELKLPEAPHSEVPSELSGRFVLSIDAEGDTYIGGARLDETELQRRLSEAKEAVPALKLRIRADKQTEFREVKQVMRLAAELGIETYLYATYQGAKGDGE